MAAYGRLFSFLLLLLCYLGGLIVACGPVGATWRGRIARELGEEGGGAFVIQAVVLTPGLVIEFRRSGHAAQHAAR